LQQSNLGIQVSDLNRDWRSGLVESLHHSDLLLVQLLHLGGKQKEDILLGLKDAGYTTLMCGDGTNDVGALKQAHV
jgi:soluble P-type ATPase